VISGKVSRYPMINSRLRILVAVATCDRPASRAEVSNLADVGTSTVRKMVGTYIERTPHEDGLSTWSLTQLGRETLDQLGEETHVCEWCKVEFRRSAFDRGCNRRRHCSLTCARKHALQRRLDRDLERRYQERAAQYYGKECNHA
jgi:hypothetical protein